MYISRDIQTSYSSNLCRNSVFSRKRSSAMSLCSLRSSRKLVASVSASSRAISALLSAASNRRTVRLALSSSRSLTSRVVKRSTRVLTDISGALCVDPMRNLNGDVIAACIVPPDREGDAMRFVRFEDY
jgi:hypothetical protein